MSDQYYFRVEGPDREGSLMRGFASFSDGPREIVYTEHDGLAYVEGDILLGRAEDVRRGTFVELARRMARTRAGLRGPGALRALVSQEYRELLSDLKVLAQERLMVKIGGSGEVKSVLEEVADGGPDVLAAAVVSNRLSLWPDGQIPYKTQPGLAHDARVLGAIAHWHAADAGIYLRPAETGDANYVVFVSHEHSASSVGMVGGQQVIKVGINAPQGSVIHEIGHAVGLWHEQSREDRRFYVTINYANIPDYWRSNFDQHIHDGDDVGDYDFGSIMHYPRDAFARDPNIPTIVPRKPYASQAARMGQRYSLSDSDVAAVRFLYRYSPASDDSQ